MAVLAPIIHLAVTTWSPRMIRSCIHRRYAPEREVGRKNRKSHISRHLKHYDAQQHNKWMITMKNVVIYRYEMLLKLQIPLTFLT